MTGGRDTATGGRGALLLRVPAALAGALGGVLLIVAETSTLYSVRVLTVIEKSVAGHQQHGWALLVLGLVALVLSVGVAIGARPAMVALAGVGLAALIIGGISDASVVHSTGVVAEFYSDARAVTGTGYGLETAGAILCLVAGVSSAVLGLGRAPLRLPRLRRRAPAAALPENPFADGG